MNHNNSLGIRAGENNNTKIVLIFFFTAANRQPVQPVQRNRLAIWNQDYPPFIKTCHQFSTILGSGCPSLDGSRRWVSIWHVERYEGSVKLYSMLAKPVSRFALLLPVWSSCCYRDWLILLFCFGAWGHLTDGQEEFCADFWGALPGFQRGSPLSNTHYCWMLRVC